MGGKSCEPRVSITLAAFNVENYITECLSSIVSQTFQDLEIICIDDASEDATLKIMQKFAKKDRRIRIISKEKNEGLAVARNESLELARGEYITFFDGDDVYDKFLIEKAVALADSSACDMVVWDYSTFKNKISRNGDIRKSQLLQLDYNDKVSLLNLPGFAWTKLLRTCKIREIGVVFPIGLTRQDIPVHWHLILSDIQMRILPERLVHYRQQPTATTAKRDKRVLDLAKIMDLVGLLLIEKGLYEEYKPVYLQKKLDFLFGMYDVVNNEHKATAFEMVISRLGKDELLYIKRDARNLRFQSSLFYKSLQGDVLSFLSYKIWLLTRWIYRAIRFTVNFRR